MKNTALKLIIVLSVFVFSAGLTNTVTAGVIQRHSLDLTLQPRQSRLTAVDQVTYLPQGGKRAVFFLAPQVEIEQVQVDGRQAPYSFHRGGLTIDLGDQQDAESVKISIGYAGRFDDPAPRGAPLNTEDPTYGVAATITPEGTFLGGGAGWYPYQPEGRSRFHVRVTAPEGTFAVTSGRLVEQQTTDGRSITTWETSYAIPSLSISAGKYTLDKKMAGVVPVYTFFYPQSRHLAQTYLNAAAEYLKLYQDLFGPYPFDKFAVVENFFPTGYGFPSWTLLGSSVVHLPFIVETSLGHEIAHSWWGTGVRVDYQQGNWSEGLTTYVADYLYQERSSQEEAKNYRLKVLRDYAALVSRENDFPLKRFLRRDSRASQAIGYGKSAMVFHMARQTVGDEAFWKALRTIADESMFEQVDWSDFARTMGRFGEQDMTGFFDQWVKREGAPFLRLDAVEAVTTGSATRIKATLVQDEPVYDLQVDVRLETDTGSIDKRVMLKGREHTFSFKTDQVPKRLVVDPEAHLFRRLAPEEVPPIVNSVRGAGQLTVVVADDLPEETARAAGLLLQAMNRTDARVLAESDISHREVENMEGVVLFFGLPKKFAEPLRNHPGIMIDEKGFTLHGRQYSGPNAALFAALSPNQDSQRAWAYFIPFSEAEARIAARKIPHYGKYSFLAFEQGENQDKGTWEIRQSPLIHNFN
jgi:aminopeptidase N